MFGLMAFFFLMRILMRLSEDNTFDIEDTVGKTADVYMNIPASKAGKGKIFVSVKGSTHELPAMTAGDKDLKSGTLVKIQAVEGGILVVAPINE